MFPKLTAILLAGVLLSSFYEVVISDCLFNVVNNTTEEYQPVLLYNASFGYELAIPQKGFIHLKQGQNISLLCSGERNYVRQTNANISTVTCIGENRVKLFRKEYNFEDIKCKRNVRGEVRVTDIECSYNGGKIYQIGYPPSRKDWVILITVCYISDIGRTLYTEHKIPGKEINYRSKQNLRPSFSSKGQRYNITLVSEYNKQFQKISFSDILNSTELAEKYINKDSYLTKGHLSPDADFIYATAQYSTYYYINAAPQWRSVNGGNWKSVENTVRNMATHYGDLEIITGTHGILEYNDIHGKPKTISLGLRGILPIPKYFWKIAYDQKTKKAITFIALNDPHVLSENAKKEVFCKDICEDSGYRKKKWKVPTSGYVFCCSVQDFRKKVKAMPTLEVSELLTAPSQDVTLD